MKLLTLETMLYDTYFPLLHQNLKLVSTLEALAVGRFLGFRLFILSGDEASDVKTKSGGADVVTDAGTETPAVTDSSIDKPNIGAVFEVLSDFILQVLAGTAVAVSIAVSA